MFTHGAPRSSKNSFKRGRAFPDRIGIWKCWFLKRGENRSTRRKTSRSRVENQQQTQPTYDAGSGNRTRDTLVGGERSHRCANPAPPAPPSITSVIEVDRQRENHSQLLCGLDFANERLLLCQFDV